MRVDHFLQTARAASTGAAVAVSAAQGGARFRLDDARTEMRKPVANRSVATLDTMTAIIALQENTPDESRRRQQRAQRGRDLLDTLDRIKAALLAGRLSPTDLSRLKALLGRGEASGDPALDAVMAQIELRAAVEIAKLQASGIDA